MKMSLFAVMSAILASYATAFFAQAYAETAAVHAPDQILADSQTNAAAAKTLISQLDSDDPATRNATFDAIIANGSVAQKEAAIEAASKSSDARLRTAAVRAAFLSVSGAGHRDDDRRAKRRG